MLLVLLFLLPLLTLDAIQIEDRFEDQIEDELQADQDIAHAIAAAFANYVESRWDEELVLGGSIAHGGRPVPTDQVKALLAESLANYPGTQAFSWMARDGTAITVGRPDWVSPPPEALTFLMPLGGSTDRVLSDLLTSPDGRQCSIGIARAVFRNGSYVGAVVAYLDPMQLYRGLPADRPGRSTFTLVDRRGIIVYSDSIFAQLGQPGVRISLDSPAHSALAGQAAVARSFHSAVDGTLRMGAAAPIPNEHIKWAAVANTAVSQVLAAPIKSTVRDITVLLLVAAASLAGAILLGRRFLRPLVTLQRAAKDIADGDLSARTHYEGTDELAQTAAVFDQMAERIQALVSQREQFLQVAAHELRNPMTSVKGMLSLVRHRAATGRPVGDLEQLAGVMENEIDRLSDLLNEILEAFRIHDGRLTLMFEAVDLTALVKSALKPFSVATETHRFLVTVPEHPLRVWGDLHRLEEVLRNLYSNAVKYSPAGGEVTVHLTHTGNQALLTVRDRGIGIPAGQFTKIFEEFYRATNVQGQDPGGLGLGLFICRDIIERHQGKIWAESTEGAGATFSVALPLMKREEAS